MPQSKWLLRALNTTDYANTALTAKRSNSDTTSSKNSFCIVSDEAAEASNESYYERAAIIEYEAGIPRVWAEALACVDEMPKPQQFTSRRWRQIIDGTGRLLDSHIPTLRDNKWTLYDVFACYPSFKKGADEMTGLLLWMHDNQVVESVTENAIGLRGLKNNTLINHYRHQKTKRERVMLWEMN